MPLVRTRCPASQFPHRCPPIKVLDEGRTQPVDRLPCELRRVLNIVRSDRQKMLIGQFLVPVLPREDPAQLLPARQTVHSCRPRSGHVVFTSSVLGSISFRYPAAYPRSRLFANACPVASYETYHTFL